MEPIPFASPSTLPTGPGDEWHASPALESVETPALVLDEDVLLANVRAMASVAASAGVALRPHFKTHKCVEIARIQLEHGAVGGTVAKASEAEVFVVAGVRDLVVATSVVDPRKIERLLMYGRHAEIAGVVESAEGVRAWAEAASRVGNRVPVLLEVDVGLGRTGASSEEAAVLLARRVASTPHLELRGVLGHGGHAYGAKSREEIEAIGRAEGEALVRTAEAIRAAGMPCPVVSAGSTPTAPHVAKVAGVTEIRPGNYVFHDGIQQALGVASASSCALTVLATVVARPTPERTVLDCGSKTLSSDGSAAVSGFGHVAGRRDLTLTRLWEEHALLPVPRETHLAVGDRVRVVPNHACATVNLHDELVVLRGGEVKERWRVAARGRVR
ncbi:MAG: alanine racemase [bacterium]